MTYRNLKPQLFKTEDQGRHPSKISDPQNRTTDVSLKIYPVTEYQGTSNFLDLNMNAVHLPGVPAGIELPFSFPHKPPAPSDLRYSQCSFPIPEFPKNANDNVYLIRVLTTALTRGELTWQEILEPARFHPHGSSIPGHDLVGIVERVCCINDGPTPRKPKFAPGDRVWGLVDFDRDGGAAVYTVAFERELSLLPALAPETTSLKWEEELATLPLSALTAYQALFTHGGLPASALLTPFSPDSVDKPRILLIGASGSVGIPTLQLARAASFHVTAVCSSQSVRLVRDDLQADAVIDYSSGDFISIPSSLSSLGLPKYDLVIDAVGGTLLRAVLLDPSSVLKPGGKLILIAGPLAIVSPNETAVFEQQLAQANVGVMFFIVKPSGMELDVLGGLVQNGKLRGHIDQVFALEAGVQAMERCEERGKRRGGKVVIRVAEEQTAHSMA